MGTGLHVDWWNIDPSDPTRMKTQQGIPKKGALLVLQQKIIRHLHTKSRFQVKTFKHREHHVVVSWNRGPQSSSISNDGSFPQKIHPFLGQEYSEKHYEIWRKMPVSHPQKPMVFHAFQVARTHPPNLTWVNCWSLGTGNRTVRDCERTKARRIRRIWSTWACYLELA